MFGHGLKSILLVVVGLHEAPYQTTTAALPQYPSGGACHDSYYQCDEYNPCYEKEVCVQGCCVNATCAGPEYYCFSNGEYQCYENEVCGATTGCCESNPGAQNAAYHRATVRPTPPTTCCPSGPQTQSTSPPPARGARRRSPRARGGVPTVWRLLPLHQYLRLLWGGDVYERVLFVGSTCIRRPCSQYHFVQCGPVLVIYFLLTYKCWTCISNFGVFFTRSWTASAWNLSWSPL